MRIEFPSKPVGETVNLGVDFISRLASGEVLISATVVSTLYSGTDSDPAALVNGAASIQSTQVVQSITGGILGNIYELCYSALTSLSQTLQITGYFAVVPDLP